MEMASLALRSARPVPRVWLCRLPAIAIPAASSAALLMRRPESLMPGKKERVQSVPASEG